MTGLCAVVLPGLDGSAALREPFCAALEPGLNARALAYPPERRLGYDELDPLVRAALPGTDHLIVAESFSGPLALRIAAAPPPGLRGVVLAASFTSLPVPFSRHLAALTRFMRLRAMPAALTDALLANGRLGAQARGALQAELRRCQPGVLEHRLAEVLRLGAPAPPRVPVLMLRATRDRLLPPGTTRRARSQLPEAAWQDIDGPHFLLLARARECAGAVLAFSRTLAG